MPPRRVVVNMAEPRLDRVRRIRRRWGWIESVGLRRRLELGWSLEQEGFLRVVLPLLLAWPLEAAPGFANVSLLQGHAGGWASPALVVLAATNSFLLMRYLDHRGARLREIRSPLRWLCRGLLAVPLLGFLLFPFLLRRLRALSAWALRPTVGICRLDLSASETGRGLRSILIGSSMLVRGFERSRGWIAWLFGVNSLALFVTAAWIGQGGATAGRRLTALALAWVLHGLAALTLFHRALKRGKEAGWSGSALWWPGPCACLLPLPWALLSLLAVFPVLLGRRGSSLAATALETTGSARRLWDRATEGSGRGEAGIRRRLEAHPAELALGSLCAWKLALLWPEAVLVGKLWPRLARGAGWGEAVVWAALVALGSAGLLAVGESFALGRRPHYGRYLFVALAAAESGFFVGLASREADPRAAGRVLFLTGLVLASLAVVWLMLIAFAGGARFKPQTIKGSLGWLGATCCGSLSGAAMLRSAETATIGRSGLLVLAAVSPLGSLFLGWSRVPRLLRPFRLAQVLDPSLPRGPRFQLLVLALSLFSPLGGLAVPYWLWVRDREPP